MESHALIRCIVAQYGPLPAAEAANHTPHAHGGSVIELVSKKPNALKFLTNGDVVISGWTESNTRLVESRTDPLSSGSLLAIVCLWGC